MTETKPKRRWFRFSLRTLFVLVTITSVTAWWWTRQLNWVRERHKFLATLSVDWGGERLYFTPSETGLQSRLGSSRRRPRKPAFSVSLHIQ